MMIWSQRLRRPSSNESDCVTGDVIAPREPGGFVLVNINKQKQVTIVKSRKNANGDIMRIIQRYVYKHPQKNVTHKSS